MEKQFVEGIRAYRPKEGRPEWIKLNMIIDKHRLQAWLDTQEGTIGRDPITGKDVPVIRVDLKESKAGKLYLEVDNWKPNQDKTAPQKPQNAPGDEFDGLVGPDTEVVPS